jgi:hypothetical protein
MTLEQTLQRNTLKYHCGHTMFCPQCGRILDCKRAVEIDLMEIGQLRKSYILCAPCWDDRKLAMHDLATQSNGRFTLEIQDGRVLFARKQKAK